MAWFCLGSLSAERTHAPATWITPRSLNQSATFGPERLPRRVRISAVVPKRRLLTTLSFSPVSAANRRVSSTRPVTCSTHSTESLDQEVRSST
eukprot:4409133-Heterocapsa_arctica.AAC.1